jgi:hypothetical protein
MSNLLATDEQGPSATVPHGQSQGPVRRLQRPQAAQLGPRRRDHAFATGHNFASALIQELPGGAAEDIRARLRGDVELEGPPLLLYVAPFVITRGLHDDGAICFFHGKRDALPSSLSACEVLAVQQLAPQCQWRERIHSLNLPCRKRHLAQRAAAHAGSRGGVEAWRRGGQQRRPLGGVGFLSQAKLNYVCNYVRSNRDESMIIIMQFRKIQSTNKREHRLGAFYVNGGLRER